MPTIDADIAQITQWLQTGEIDKAQAGCQALLQTATTGKATLYYLMGATLIQQGHANQAEDWLRRAVNSAPEEPQFQCALGYWLEMAQRLAEAEPCYHQAMTLAPTWGEPRWRLGRLLTLCARTQEGIDLLLSHLETEPHHVATHLWLAKTFLELKRELEASVHLRIYNHLTSGLITEESQEPLDSLFLDPQLARQEARKNLMVPGERIRCGFPGVRLCFAFGSPLADDPPSLTMIPPDGVDAFFYASPLRPPQRLLFNPADVSQCRRAWQLARTIHTVRQNRQDIGLAQVAPYARRPIAPEGPLRILLPTCRADMDSLFFAESMAKAFDDLGCCTQVLFEDLTRERYDTLDWVELFQAFHPHVVFSISQHLNYWFHPLTVNVIWWQDPVGALCQNKVFPWRSRDLNFSFSRELDPYLLKAGAPPPTILRQGFCADQEIFRPLPHIARQRKVVFVGSSYVNKGTLSQAMATPAGQRVLDTLVNRLEEGLPFPPALFSQLAKASGITQHAIFWYFFHYVVRDWSVRWLCRCGDILPVEIYGNAGWADDPIIKPFYRGVLPRGEAVAKLYNEALYTMVSHPFDLHSERMMEAAACGSIPVAFDCRLWSEPPHWDEHCLWFNTLDQLRQCFHKTPANDPTLIARHATSHHFAQRVLQEIQQRGFWPVEEMLQSFSEKKSAIPVTLQPKP